MTQKQQAIQLANEICDAISNFIGLDLAYYARDPNVKVVMTNLRKLVDMTDNVEEEQGE